MPDIIDGISRRFADSWFVDLPGGHIVAPTLASAIGAVMRVAHASGAPNDDPDAWVRQLFLTPDTVRAPEAVVDRAAGLMQGWMPSTFETAGTATENMMREKREAGAQHPPRALEADIANSILSSVQSQPRASAIASLPTSFAALRSAAPQRWTPEDLNERIRGLMRRFRDPTLPHVRRFVVDAELELARVPARFAFATALAASDLALPIFRSSADVGSEVHSRLQSIYRAEFRDHRIVAEGTAYTPGQSPLALRPASAIALLKSGDFSLAALTLARFSPFSPRGTLRDDVLDLSEAKVWEIKPVLSAPAGVLQESWYRTSYNFWAAVFLEIGGVVNPPWVRGGEDWHDRSPRLLEEIPTSAGTALPFCLDLLPGLVLYVVLRSLSRAELQALISALAALLAAVVQSEIERARKLGEAAARAARAFLEVLRAVGEALAKALVYIVIAAAFVVAIILAVQAAAAAGLAAAAAALLVIIGGSIFYQRGDDESEEGQDRPKTTAHTVGEEDRLPGVSLGPCTLRNVTTGDLVEVMKRINAFLPSLVEAGVEALGARPSTSLVA